MKFKMGELIFISYPRLPMERRIRGWQCVIEKDVVRRRKGKAGIIG